MPGVQISHRAPFLRGIMSRDESIRKFAEQLKKADEQREHYQWVRNNPNCREAKISRLIAFLLVTLIWGTFFMGMFYIAYLIEGGWFSWFKYFCYGTGAIVGLKVARHKNLYP